MTDKWFLQELEQQLKHRKRTVILDPKGQCGFLLPLLEDKGYKLFKNDVNLTEQWQIVQEELQFRYEAETRYQDTSVVFYLVREQDKLSFLFDYCFTHGCVDLSNPIEWLRNKLFKATGLQISLDTPLLMVAAKIGIRRSLDWWKKILQGLEELISIEDELLPFLHEPESFLKSKEKDISRLLQEKIFELIGQPYISKPPKTLALEVANHLFNGLINDSVPDNLMNVYFKWVDSSTYSSSLEQYVSQFKIDNETNVWAVNPNHCFNAIDREALRQITANLRNTSYVAEKLLKVKQRAASYKVKKFVPVWWQDVITLLEFDGKGISTCTNLDKIVDYYTRNFAEVDRAIRNLYALFLQEEEIIRPLQEYYESLNRELLDRWFEYVPAYSSNQQGYLAELLKTAKPGTAVIVGDGIRYEIADHISNTLQKQFEVEKNIILADIPSDTENNMSALYAGNNEVLKFHKDREKRLLELTEKDITFINLDALHYGFKAEYLVLTYKDIDATGESLQQGAIKLFSEFEKKITDTVTLLLKMGYREVFLITDHGFVLTGLLDEADKIEPKVTGKSKVGERFIRTVEKQSNTDWISFDKKYEDYNYVVVAKNHRPFKSKGVYGYSHGGFTPQEVIVPNFKFSKVKEAIQGLEVKISNKSELNDVTGNIFAVKLEASKAKGDLFSSSRKVQLLLFANNKQISMSNINTINAGGSIINEFSFNNNESVTASLIDVETSEQLDNVIIKKSKARDLGGLL